MLPLKCLVPRRDISERVKRARLWKIVFRPIDLLFDCCTYKFARRLIFAREKFCEPFVTEFQQEDQTFFDPRKGEFSLAFSINVVSKDMECI
jgi:hypothetical protein